jgi:hypothetical protein
MTNILIYVTNPACATTATAFHISSPLPNTRSWGYALYELLYSPIFVEFSPEEKILYSTLWRMILYVVGGEKRICIENEICNPRKYIVWGFMVFFRNKLFPVTTVWRVLRLRMQERPPIWRVAANILNKESRTANSWWSSSLLLGWGANNSLPWNVPFYEVFTQKASDLYQGTCECGNEPSGPIKWGEFID